MAVINSQLSASDMTWKRSGLTWTWHILLPWQTTSGTQATCEPLFSFRSFLILQMGKQKIQNGPTWPSPAPTGVCRLVYFWSTHCLGLENQSIARSQAFKRMQCGEEEVVFCWKFWTAADGSSTVRQFQRRLSYQSGRECSEEQWLPRFSNLA